MRLKVILPSGVILEQVVSKVVAEAENGSFCLLPHHVDFTAALVPGVLAYVPTEGEEAFLGVDEGVLVKRGPEVMVSTWNAVRGPLGELKKAVREQFQRLNEREQKARSALGKLEASLVHQILQWEERSRG